MQIRPQGAVSAAEATSHGNRVVSRVGKIQNSYKNRENKVLFTQEVCCSLPRKGKSDEIELRFCTLGVR